MIARRRPNRAPKNPVVMDIVGAKPLWPTVNKTPKYASVGIQSIILKYMGEPLSTRMPRTHPKSNCQKGTILCIEP